MDSEDTNSPSPMDSSGPSTDENSPPNIMINVHPTTGGQFEIEISPDETADELKRKISRRLQTPKERLKVLFKEQVLEGKPLKDYNVVDGSKVTLLPAVESGFSSTVQGTQQSIIQAIESLSDPQIDDFLSGRLPLTLALRVGDHMMFVQLQLEQSSQHNSHGAGPSRSRRGHPAVPFSQQNHPLVSAAPCLPPRLLPEMHNLSIPAALAATALLPKPSTDFGSKKSPSRTSPALPDTSVAGPAPKVPKLSERSESDRRSSGHYAKEEPSIVYKPAHFHHQASPVSPDELPHPMFDPSFQSLQQLTNHYREIASHVNHSQASANHLHKLATACSSLGQVVAIPPSGGPPLKVPTLPDHKVKSSRKRPSTLVASDYEASASSHPQNSAFLDSAASSALPTPAAIIQNALLRQHQLSGFPPPPSASLLPSAYARYQASNRARQGSTSSQTTATTPTSPPTEIRLKHPITSNMLQACSSSNRHTGSASHSSSGSKSERSGSHHHHHGHRRSSSTSGKITSSSMSTHHPSGARVARQMQRLRRLCGSHQQCVAYSNRELATEISSIVHMAKHSHHHHSRSDGSHRKSHKACRECHGRDRTSGSSRAAASSAQAGQAAGACIDSFTTHGPGIFSGTFSGSLHPSIQDKNGKPKRDPKTILQILTDLLNATQQYQGQLGNVGLLPQLFKDHFKGENGAEGAKEGASGKDGTKPEVTLIKAEAVGTNLHGKSQKGSTAKEPTTQNSSQRTVPKQSQNQMQQVYQHPYILPPRSFIPMTQNSSSGSKVTPAPASYLSSVSTIPIGNIPAYGHHVSSSSSSHSRSRKNSPSSGHEGSSKHHHHHHGRCHHYKHQFGSGASEKSSCCGVSSSSKRQSKSQMLNSAYVKRLKQLQHENNNTRSKMKELKKMMEIQRLRRQCRRTASKLYNRRNATEGAATRTHSVLSPAGNTVLTDGHTDASAQGGLKGGKMEVQFDDIQEYEIKEVAHEPPETVTV